MNRFLLASAAALSLMATAGMAATTTSETTEVTSAPPPVAPTTVSRTTAAQRTPDGVQTLTSGVTARDGNGNVAGTTNSTRSYPLSNMITTTQKKIETINGVPTEVVTTTNSYPGSNAAPYTSTTRTAVSDEK